MGEAQWQAGCDVGRPGHAAQRDHSHTGRHPAHLLGGWGELHKHNGLRGAAALPRRLRDLVRAAAAPVRRAPGPQDAAGRDEAAGRGVRAEPGLALRDRARRRLRLGGAAHRRLCGHLRVAPEGAQRPGPAGVRQPGQGGLDPACANLRFMMTGGRPPQGRDARPPPGDRTRETRGREAGKLCGRLVPYCRSVPTVSLRTVLGSWLAWPSGGGWPIDYLKIDAQGLDLEVLRSAGDALLPRVLRVEMEVPGDACRPMYEGSPGCSAIFAAMAHMGYTEAYNRSCADFAGVCYEDDYEFVRPGVFPLHYGRLPWGDECWTVTGQVLKQACCSDLFLSRFRHCWDTDFRLSRCCIHRWQPHRRSEVPRRRSRAGWEEGQAGGQPS
mmetsp:Transcript_46147/g.144539  ORF Transcript_46147/g.144539 Transcript_46147/m.144539 type:complete len:383 (-) Transcript_46147:37-1185(-)